MKNKLYEYSSGERYFLKYYKHFTFDATFGGGALLSGFYGNELLIAYHTGRIVRVIGGWLPQIVQLILPQYHYGNVVTLAVTRSKMY